MSGGTGELSAGRIEWIDAVKGIGIICVILGHMTIPEVVRQFIFSFHMPLFFFISGYLYNNNGGGGHWALRKMDALIIPYVLYGILEVIVGWQCKGVSPCGLLVGLLHGNGAGVTWFLMCLLMTEMIGAAFLRAVRWEGLHLVSKVAIAVAVAAIGWTMPKWGLPHVCMISVTGAALAFWLWGAIAKNIKSESILVVPWAGFYIFLAVLVLVAFFLSRMQRIDMASARFGNPFLFYSTALIMIVTSFAICRRLVGKSKVLGYFGRNSLLFMGFHNIMPPATMALLLSCGMDVNASVLVKLMSRLMNLALLVAVVQTCARHVPPLAGRMRLFSRDYKNTSASC